MSYDLLAILGFIGVLVSIGVLGRAVEATYEWSVNLWHKKRGLKVAANNTLGK
ncbi:hypothetical protein [Weissella tructae]|uniref:hypothetical protein n=1 Tax=Weissella tructae TaxID=887702 RepID=UPI001BDCC08E|nr:hypothetical protein [Weissella tructae]QVV90852.1 hypothetical protein KHQ32_04255 [Weissella tructae]